MTAALGAGRMQLLRQVGLEHGVLVVAGGGGGLALCQWGLLALKGYLPPSIAHLVDVRLDAYLLVVALTVGLLLLLTFAPFARLRRRDLAARLRAAPRGGASSRESLRTRHGLVAGQVAVSLVLMTLAGLLTGSFVRLDRVDPGYRTADLVATYVSWPTLEGEDADPLRPISLHRQLLEEMRSQPGIRAAASARYLVLDDRPGDMSFEFEGRPVPEGRKKPAADWQVVTPSYFETMGIALDEGRVLDASDDEQAHGAIVVDQAFVNRFLPDEPAIGRRLRFGGEHTGPRWATIVGVVGNVRHAQLDETEKPRVYIAHAQFRRWSNGRPLGALHLIIDTQLPLESAQQLVRSAVERVSQATPVDPLRPIHSLRAQSLLLPRLLALLPTIFSGAALLLAMIGLFGIVVQSVIARRTEMGIRQTLGARRLDLIRVIFWDGFRWALVGGAGGSLVALLLATAVESRLYATSAFDPIVLLGAWLLLAAAVSIACLIPALRAARIDPISLLRSE